MEIEVNAIIVRSLDHIDLFPIKVSSNNYERIRAKLELERKKAINILKKLKQEGEIKSIYMPKNKKLSNELSYLVKMKREIRKSIKKIDEVFNR